MRSVARDARRLALTSVAGAALNALKLGLIALMLDAAQIDLLTAGLLLCTTFAQMVGEPVASHAAAGRSGLGRAVAALPALALAAFLAAALAPGAALALAAPGLAAPAGADVAAIRLFGLAGAAALALWWAAGAAQRHLDLGGLQAIALVPNAALVLALVVPLGPVLPRVALAMLLGTAAAAALVGRRAYVAARRAAPAVATGHPAGLAAATGGLAALLLLAAGTQSNLVVARLLGSGLPEGSLSALFLATGIAYLPALAVGASLASALLPRWAADAAGGRLARPGVAAAWAAAVTALLTAPIAVAALVLRAEPAWAGALDPALRDGLALTLPILCASAPIHAAAWVLRARAIAGRRAGRAGLLGLAGGMTVGLCFLARPTLGGLALGYALSAVPLLAAGLRPAFALRRPVGARPATAPARSRRPGSAAARTAPW